MEQYKQLCTCLSGKTECDCRLESGIALSNIITPSIKPDRLEKSSETISQETKYMIDMCRDEIARKHNYNSWAHLIYSVSDMSISAIIINDRNNEAMELYTSQVKPLIAFGVWVIVDNDYNDQRQVINYNIINDKYMLDKNGMWDWIDSSKVKAYQTIN